jgi:hypothetical protein
VENLESRLHMDASRVAWGSFVGHDALDTADAVGVDQDNNIYVAGTTQSIGWFDQSLFNGKRSPDTGTENGYVVKLSSDGQFIWGTYIGGPQGETVSCIAVDPTDASVYVAGTTSGGFTAFSPDGNVQSSHGGTDGFAAKIDKNGQFVWATAIGGTGDETAMGIAVSGTKVIVVGNTDSSDFGFFSDDSVDPDSEDYQPPLGLQYGDNGDAFVTALKTETGQALWGVYLPGTGHDEALAVTADDKQIFVTGSSDSTQRLPGNPADGTTA